MNRQQLTHLLKGEEGFKLDFKSELKLEYESDRKECVKDVIAIANTPGGRGYIIFGIEDQTKKILGIKDLPPHTEERIQQIIANRSSPPIPIRFDVVTIENKIVGVITIFRSMQVPHQMIQTGAFYIRRGSTTDKANRHEIANMLQQYGMLSFENVPCRSSTLEDLDHKAIKRYCNHLSIYNQQHQLLLATMGILATDLEKERYYPTYGGLLLFGKRPQNFIPQSVLEINDKGTIMGIEGNIIEILKKFKKIIVEKLPSPYPVEGLLEVVTNALIHRNYWNNGQYTQVVITEDKIVVTNPISHEIYEEKAYRFRVNPWLYARLLLMQQQNQFHLGIGLERTKVLFQEQGEVKIYSNRLENIFEVTLPGTGEKKEEEK